MITMFLGAKAIINLPGELRTQHKPCHIAGYSLLEILISLCILSFGLLGFAQAQLLALRNNQIAYMQSIAQTRLLSLAEILQACDMVKCSNTSLVKEIQSWNIYNAHLLPEGQGNVIQQEIYQVITLHWQTAEQNHTSSQAKLFMPIFHD